jgi:hypothetical protein
MTKPTIRIHNTGTNIITDREMTDAEFAQYETDLAAEATRIAEALAAKTAEEAAKQQAFNDAVSAAVAVALAAQQP